MVPWVGLQCEIVVFPGHTYLLSVKKKTDSWCMAKVQGERKQQVRNIDIFNHLTKENFLPWQY